MSGCRPTIYGSPSLYYGIGARYGGCYDPTLSAHNTTPEQPVSPAVTVRFYDPSKNLRAYMSSNTGFNPFGDISFELTDQGCGRASLELLFLPVHVPQIVTQHGSWFEVHLWNSPRPIWSGTVVRRPGDGSTDRTIRLEGIGFLDMVKDVILANLEASPVETRLLFEDWACRDVVAYIAQKLEDQTFVVRNDAKIEDSAKTTYEATLFYIRQTAKEALDELADLVGGAVWGVDVDRELFFESRDTTISAERTLVVGRDIEEWEPTEDSSKIGNYLHIRHGQTVVDQTDPAFGTNFLVGFLRDDASVSAYGLRERTVSAPSIYNTLDAYRYGASKLEQMKGPALRGLAPKVTFRGTEFKAGKTYRVVSGDVVTDLPCKRVRYQVRPSGRTEVTLHLGDDKDDLPGMFVDLATQQAKRDSESRLNQFENVEARPPA